MICPKCHSRVAEGATECSCGFKGAAPVPPPPPAPRQPSSGIGGGRAIALALFGALAVVGVLMTVLSHDSAVQRGGGHYRIYTGAIAGGVIGMFRVLFSGKA